jgi:hypothetical protein
MISIRKGNVTLAAVGVRISKKLVQTAHWVVEQRWTHLPSAVIGSIVRDPHAISNLLRVERMIDVLGDWSACER